MMQGPSGSSVRGPSSAAPGSTISVEVADSVTQIEVGTLGSPFTVVYPVTSGKAVAVQVPSNIETGFLVITTKGSVPVFGIVVSVISPR
jgi:hypothetical protein